MTTTREGARRLFARLAILGSPMAVLLLIYVIADPFKVIRKYQWGNYYDGQRYELNREFVSTEMLLANYPRYNFDAYILGSSRSFPYHCDAWEKHLPGARAFHYPAASETIYGIHRKLAFLDDRRMPLRYSLIIIDAGALEGVVDRTDHLHISHPAVSGEGRLRFQSASLQGFLSTAFWLKFVDYSLFGTIRPYMAGVFAIAPGRVRIDPVTNDYFFDDEERRLAEDPERFYAERRNEFPPRTCQGQCYHRPVVGDKQRQILLAMREILERNQTRVKVVVTPLYDQVQMHSGDLQALQQAFGRANVYDFSGVNEFNANMKDYYDGGHYRPHIANAILDRIYSASASP